MDRILLEESCEILDSRRIPITASNRKEGPYPYYGANGIQDYVDDYIFDDELVVLAEDGGNFGSKERPIAYRVSGKCWVNNHAHVLKPKDGMNVDYLCYSLMFYDTEKLVNGATRQKLTQAMMRKILIPKRSISEQKKIVDTLNTIQNSIAKQTKRIKLLDNLIKARFVEMFGTSGANPKGWNEIKLGEVCSLQNGYAFKSSDYINKSSVLNCRMSNIRPDGGFDAEYHPKYLPDEYWDKCSGYRLFDGDVIIAMTDMASDPKILGVPTIVSTNGKKFLLNQRVGKLSFLHDDRMNRVYLMHSLGQKYIRKELAKSAAGSTQINVGKPAILNINIYDPPRSLQDQFATFVAQVDKSKFAVQKSLEKTQLLFDSLMQEYFG